MMNSRYTNILNHIYTRYDSKTIIDYYIIFKYKIPRIELVHLTKDSV